MFDLYHSSRVSRIAIVGVSEVGFAHDERSSALLLFWAALVACATHMHTARSAFNVVYVTAHVVAGKWIGADQD